MDIQNRYFVSNRKWKEEKARREKEGTLKGGNVPHLFKPKKPTNKFLPTPQSFYQRQKAIKEADKQAMVKFSEKKAARHNFRLRLRDLSLARDELATELNLKIVGELPTGQGKAKFDKVNGGKRVGERQLRVDSVDSEVENIKDIYLNEDLEDALEDEDEYNINRSILVDLFQQFAPYRLREVDDLLKKHKNDTVALFEKLAKRFKINPEDKNQNKPGRTTYGNAISGSRSMPGSSKTVTELKAFIPSYTVPASDTQAESVNTMTLVEKTTDEVDQEIADLTAANKDSSEANKAEVFYGGIEMDDIDEPAKPNQAPPPAAAPVPALVDIKPEELGSSFPAVAELKDEGKRNKMLSKNFRGKTLLKTPTGTLSQFNKYSRNLRSSNGSRKIDKRSTRNSLNSFQSVQTFQSLPAPTDSPEVEEFKQNLDKEIKSKLYSGEYVVSILESGGHWWVNRNKPTQHSSQRKRNTMLDQLRNGTIPIPE